jgi:hypothetical protein
MPKRLSALIAVFSMSAMLIFGSTGTAAAQVTIPINNVDVTNAAGDVVGTFNGAFEVTRFRAQGGQLVAVGTLTGTVTNAAGDVLATVNRTITLPVDVAQATCEILDLRLGPLDLDLLGLVIHLDEVHLNITAEQGPGNLLGNLLCAIAGLLDNPATPLASLARLLNRILAILG